ncbi:MAG: hypothetical protein K0U18_06510 [Betaproteobacteria bacterium]|nr:hypothetical protein [Betaproteobacteria bacterium]
MKTTLKQILVLRLTLNEKPTSHNNRKLIFDRDSSLPHCIVFDDRRESPIGFGVKIIKTKKTYIIQRRVSIEQAIEAKVDNVSDFPNRCRQK